MTPPLLTSLWVSLIGWTLLHCSDYALTLWTARLLQGRAGTTIHFEGGVELTPQFRADIARLRRVSPRFLLALALVLAYLAVSWVLAWEARIPEVYRVVAGGMLLLELVVHLRHIRNLVLLKFIESRGQPEGRLSYPRWLVLRTSSIELLSFTGLFLIIFILSGAWETLGGAIVCGLVALRHAWWSAREPGSAA
jgi:hypothetical protein